MTEGETTKRREWLRWAVAGGAAVFGGGLAEAGQQMMVTGQTSGGVWDVRNFGAKGDGSTVDTDAINRAIEAAANAGGGTVRFPGGKYISYSIHLKSNVTLYLDTGAQLIAGDSPRNTNEPKYDAAETNEPWESYQDFGHNHWHNSLIWGENLNNVAILGPGLIWGRGLSAGHRADGPRAEDPGVGNKAIALKNCRNVLLRDFSILKGGHFGILATGVDNLTIDNLTIDTDRDGMDIDCCRNVRVSNCSVNSPWDDGICLKSSYALGKARSTDTVTITNCVVSGSYELGSMLDASFRKFAEDAKVPRTGRIKFGTESNGGFRNITISNCVFDGCQGLALESVDGALLEDVTITNIAMRDISSAPIFLRLGERMRGPQGAAVGTCKRVLISNVVCHGSKSRVASVISGVPEHYIEDVKLTDMYLNYEGGGTKAMAATEPAEQEKGYPDPERFFPMPASGFYIRHVKNIVMSNIQITDKAEDGRPTFFLNDVEGADFFRIRAPQVAQVAMFQLKNVRDFSLASSRPAGDTHLAQVAEKSL